MLIQYDIDIFPDSYSIARERFLMMCAGLPGKSRAFRHPTEKYHNYPLTTDVFWLGPEEATKVLVVMSATHGVEGFCGSAAQANWLQHVMLPTNDVAILFIHALNPFGFAHLRRVNENNVDLNRNFVDFTAHLPDNNGYRELASVLLPEYWNDELNQIAQEKIHAYQVRYGRSLTEQAISGGQYQFPDGLFYGGSKPAWSHLVIKTIIADYRLTQRNQVIVVDIHSGLGPYGYGEIISDHAPGSPGAQLAKLVFGDSVTEPLCGTSTSVPKFGLLDYVWHAAFGENGCFVTLEFGTYSVDEMFAILREENYYWQRFNRNEIDTEQMGAVSLRLRDYFYPDKTDWKEMILFRSEQVLTQALTGLCTY